MPNQPPINPEHAQPAPPVSAMPRVDGNCLVVPAKVELPRYCIFTGRPVADDGKVTQTLQYSPHRLAHLLLDVIGAVVVEYLTRQTCQVTWYVSRSIRIRRAIRKAILFVLVVPALFALVIAIAWGQPVAVVITGVILAAILLYGMIAERPLRVVRYQDGMFWIKGFRPEFFRSCGWGESNAPGKR